MIKDNDVLRATISKFAHGYVCGEDADQTGLKVDLAKLEESGVKKGSKKQQNVTPGIEYLFDFQKVRLPEPGKRNTLVTSALPYVNNVPHLGNVIGAVLSADVYARYCRQRGDQVIYICGTDEFGTTTETKALEEKTTCAEVCAKYFKLHASVYDWFQIHFDHFGRTTNEYQTPITHELFNQLYKNGYFFEDSIEQTFCITCDRFLADRFVEGTCPLCSFNDARGDQCDGCGKLINSVELKNPRCKVCKDTPEIRSSKHLFLDLVQLTPKLEKFVEEAAQRGTWTSNSVSIARAWLHEGLRPRCMTRDLKWGTSVPVPGYENKVFYVWFDAPIGYISLTASYAQGSWREWWAHNEETNVNLVQFMGKDNVPFHTVTFPGTLFGLDERLNLLHTLSTTEYLNYENSKFSKSRGTGVFGLDARDSGIPAALWRYYLLSTRPESTDAIFTWDDFGNKCNSELLANLGNLVNRTSKFLHSKLEGRIGKVLPSDEPAVQSLVKSVNEHLTAYLAAMDKLQLRAALKEAMGISAAGNLFLVEAKLDGKLLASDPERCRSVLSTTLNLIYLLSAVLEPFLPSVSQDILSILNAPARRIPFNGSWSPEEGLLEGHIIGQPFILFQKLEEEFLVELRTRFSGLQK